MTPPAAPLPPRVLVIDDSLTMRLFYRSLLDAAGFTVEEAANGGEGYDRVLAEPFDLLIVDVNMPKMDGYTLLRTVRQDPGVRDVPAVMISTEAGPHDRDKAYAAGANFYLVKPVEPEVLVEVARLMTGRRS